MIQGSPETIRKLRKPGFQGFSRSGGYLTTTHLLPDAPRPSKRALKVLLGGGPGSGCNPEVGKCGRPGSGQSDTQFSSVTNVANKAAKVFGLSTPSIRFTTDSSGKVSGEHGGEHLTVVNAHLTSKFRGLNFTPASGIGEAEHIAAHEVVHQAFSKDSDLGHEMMQRLSQVKAEYGSSVSIYGAFAGAFENLIELGAAYSHSPKELQKYSPDMYAIAKEWASKLKSIKAGGPGSGRHPEFGNIKDTLEKTGYTHHPYLAVDKPHAFIHHQTGNWIDVHPGTGRWSTKSDPYKHYSGTGHASLKDYLSGKPQEKIQPSLSTRILQRLVHAGGPGSGCNPEVGKCGRPSTGSTGQFTERKPGHNTIVMSFGRFNPPHRGHKLLLDKLAETAKAHGGDPVLFVNPKQNDQKDPLNVQDKAKYVQMLNPEVQVHWKPKSEVPDPEDIIKLYSEQGYKHLVLVEGGDREKWFHDLIQPRMESGELKFKDWKFVSAGDRDTEQAWSATQQRDAAKKGDYTAFRQGLPKDFSEEHAREMFQKVREGMKLAAAVDEEEEDTWPDGWGDLAPDEMDAGGPGSGCNPEVGKCGRPPGPGHAESPVTLKVPPSEYPLTREQKDAEDRFRKQIESDPEKAIREYTEKYKNVLNADDAKELSADYRANRSDMAMAVHEGASALVKEIYKRELAKDAPPDKANMVVFTAGGAGAGKTHTVSKDERASAIIKQAQIVYDGTLRPANKAIRRIEQALDAGKKVIVAFVDRDPVDSFRAALGRAASMEKKLGSGRTVPLGEFVNQHTSVRDSMMGVNEKFRDNPDFHMMVFRNGGGKEPSRLVPSMNDLPPGRTDKEGLTKELKGVLEDAYRKGEISKTIYKATLAEGFAHHKEVGV